MTLTDSIFGQVLTRSNLEDAVVALLRKWMDTYLAEVERQNGIPVRTLPRPRSIERRNAFEHWVEEQLPSLVVVSPGTVGPPRKRGGGSYVAEWAVGIAAIAGGKDANSTRDLVDLYTAAVRMLILQRPSLEGFAIGATWEDEHYDDIADSDVGRTMASGQVVFQITVEDLVFANAGPITPDDPPTTPPDTSPTWPIVDTVHLDVELEGVNE